MRTENSYTPGFPETPETVVRKPEGTRPVLRTYEHNHPSLLEIDGFSGQAKPEGFLASSLAGARAFQNIRLMSLSEREQALFP